MTTGLAESNGSTAGFMTHVTCRLTAKNLDQLWNPTLGNRVWATFTLPSCIRIGPRYDATCASIVSLDDHAIPWTTEVRYVGIYIVSSRVFKCSLHYAQRRPIICYHLWRIKI